MSPLLGHAAERHTATTRCTRTLNRWEMAEGRNDQVECADGSPTPERRGAYPSTAPAVNCINSNNHVANM